MNFSLIISTKDRQDILTQSLAQISRSKSLADIEVIIVNDSDQPLVLSQKYSFAVVKRNVGSGVASARNYGASLATHDWLIFMDDDMLVQPDTFNKLLPFCVFEDRCLNVNWLYPDIVTKQLRQKPFLRYLRYYGFDSLEGWNRGSTWQNEGVFRVDGITSQFLMLHKNTFNRVGGYNTSFPFAGFEDHDLSGRLKQKNIAVYIDSQNLIFHNEADRIDVENWLERKRRGAITRRVAVYLGYRELMLNYSWEKKSFYKLMYSFRNPLLHILKNWPDTTLFDKGFFLLVNIFLGTYSYIGYSSRQAQDYIKNAKAKTRLNE